MLGDIRVCVCRRAWETCVIFELNSILFTQGYSSDFYGNLEKKFFFQASFFPLPLPCLSPVSTFLVFLKNAL